MKIKSIEVLNYKAVEEKTINLNGCSAIITGANNKGKTSILKGLIDRMRGERAEFVVKKGEEKGSNCIELTDGSRFEWKFTEKSEQITYITKEGLKINSGVLKQLGTKYFGQKFDIDKFLSSSPKEQVNVISKLIGIDLSDINKRYAEAYQERTIVNRELKNIQAKNLIEPLEIVRPDFDSLKTEKQKIKNDTALKNESIRKENEEKKQEYLEKLNVLTFENQKFNEQQQDKEEIRANTYSDIEEIISIIRENKILKDCFDTKKALKIYEELEQGKPQLPIPPVLDEPEYQELIQVNTDEIDLKIEDAQKKETAYQIYLTELTTYNEWIEEKSKKSKLAAEKDKNVKDIEQEKFDLVNKAKLPKEFTFTEDSLYYNGLPLTENQMSSSARYIAALKLNALVIGDVKTMHFDASFLDKVSLKEINDWAIKNDLQLLIERPDFEAGEIQYNIINNE